LFFVLSFLFFQKFCWQNQHGPSYLGAFKYQKHILHVLTAVMDSHDNKAALGNEKHILPGIYN